VENAFVKHQEKAKLVMETLQKLLQTSHQLQKVMFNRRGANRWTQFTVLHSPYVEENRNTEGWFKEPSSEPNNVLGNVLEGKRTKTSGVQTPTHSVITASCTTSQKQTSKVLSQRLLASFVYTVVRRN
jgi:hypothetical protein